MTSAVRLVYLGTPTDAISPLRALVGAGHDVALVVTQPDRRRSRGAGSDPSPVRAAAEELGLLVRTPAKAREVIDDVRASGAELGVVVAFGQLLPVSLLEALPRHAAPGAALPAVAGSVPTGLDDPPGCAFAPRCPLAVADCVTHRIALEPVGEHRRVACIRREET